jgi:ketosteroid isomerase-like protein
MGYLKTVEGIYAAFGRGDIPAILEHLAEGIEWDYGHGENPVPWLKPRRGRAGVAEFFESAAGLEFHKFAPHTFIEGPNIVVVLVDVDATVKKSGRRFSEDDELHLWRFDTQGRVVRFRHGVDTHKHVQAFNS